MTGFNSADFNSTKFNQSQIKDSLVADGFGSATGQASLNLKQDISASGGAEGSGLASVNEFIIVSGFGSGVGTGSAAELQKSKEFRASGANDSTGSGILSVGQTLAASGDGDGVGSGTISQSLSIGAQGIGEGVGVTTLRKSKFFSAAGAGLGDGSARILALIGNWAGADDGEVASRASVGVQGGGGQEWLIKTQKSPSDKATFISNKNLKPDVSTALGSTTGSFGQGAFGWHIRIDDTNVLRDTDTLRFKVGSCPNDYAVWTLDGSELGDSGEFKYLVFSNTDYESIVGSPDWTKADFFELTLFEKSGNTTDTSIYVDYLTVSDRDDVGATGVGDRRGPKKPV